VPEVVRKAILFAFVGTVFLFLVLLATGKVGGINNNNNNNNNIANVKVQTYFTGEITLHVAQMVNTEKLQRYVYRRNVVCQSYNCTYPA
jgi:hypothetical protein